MYMNSPTLFRMVPSPTPTGHGLLKIGGSQPPPKTSIAIISGTGKARYGIHSVYPNNCSLKILEKRGRGPIDGLLKVLTYPLLSQERVKLYELQILHRIDRNKSPLKISGKVAVSVLIDSRNYSGHPYIGRIARCGHLCDSSAFSYSIAHNYMWLLYAYYPIYQR